MDGPPRETGPVDEKYFPPLHGPEMDGPPREDGDSIWIKEKPKKPWWKSKNEG